MFQEQLKELVELGNRFATAVNTVLNEATKESRTQIDIIKQARQKLAQATQTQETVAEMVESLVDNLEEIAVDTEANDILLESLSTAFDEIDDIYTEVPYQYDGAVEDTDE